MANIITNLVIGFLSIQVSQGQNFKWFFAGVLMAWNSYGTLVIFSMWKAIGTNALECWTVIIHVDLGAIHH